MRRVPSQKEVADSSVSEEEVPSSSTPNETISAEESASV